MGRIQRALQGALCKASLQIGPQARYNLWFELFSNSSVQRALICTSSWHEGLHSTCSCRCFRWFLASCFSPEAQGSPSPADQPASTRPSCLPFRLLSSQKRLWWL